MGRRPALLLHWLMWKWIKGALFTKEGGGRQGALRRPALPVNGRPTRRGLAWQVAATSLHLQVSSHPSNGPAKPPLQLPVYSRGVFVYNSIPNSSSTFLIKDCSSHLLGDLTTVLLCCGLLRLDCNPLLLNKPIFTAKITGQFCFESQHY